MNGDALFSDDRVYRYLLSRDWTKQGSLSRAVLFVMLNPSTADALVLDPTVRKCVGFATRWGYSKLLVGNIYAYRATDPKAMRAAQASGVDVTGGSANSLALRSMASEAERVVYAWGAFPWAQAHGKSVALSLRLARMLQGCPAPACVLELTSGGAPRHPLMAPYSKPVVTVDW